MADGKSVRVTIDVVAPNSAKASETVKKEVQGVADEVKRINAQTVADAKKTERIIEETTKQRIKQELADEKRLEKERKKIADDFIRSVKEMSRHAEQASANRDQAHSSFANNFAPSGGGLSSFAAEAGALPPQLQIAIAATVALGAALVGTAYAAVKGGEGLFNLAKEASDFGSEINDAAAKTGLSTATLQALRYEASQGGASFQDISTSINKFSKVLGSAQQGNKEAQSTMKSLGVTSFDLETALSEAYQTILKYPDGTSQMKASMDAFGKSGADLIPFLKEFGGNISEAKQRAAELGIILDDKTIKAADKFGDMFDTVSLQVKASVARFALEYAPVISATMQDISKWLGENQQTFVFWGDLIKGVFVLVKKAAQELAPYLKTVFDYSKTFFEAAGNFFGDISEKLLGVNLKDVFGAAMHSTSGDVAALSAEVKKVPSLADQLKADKAKKDAEILTKTIQGLVLQVQFFGDDSTVAATKTQLLSQGITNLNSGLAQQALGWAARLDQLKKNKDEQDKYNDKIKDARKYMENLRAESDFELKFPKATALDKFNEWVRRNVTDFRELNKEITLTREQLTNKLIGEGAAVRGDAYKDLDKKIRTMQEDASGSGDQLTRDFSKNIEDFLAPFGLDQKTIDQIVYAAEYRITRMRESLDKARSPEEVQFITNQEYDLAQNFFSQFKSDKGVQIFSENVDLFEKFVKLWNALVAKDQNEGLKTFNTLMDDLTGKMRESTDATEQERVAKMLLGEEYNKLTAEQKKLLEAKAGEVDAFNKAKEATKQAQEEQKRFFEDTKYFLEDVLNDAFAGRWKGVLDTMLGMLKQFVVKATAEFAAIKLFGGGGSGSGGWLGGIFKALGIGGGGGSGGGSSGAHGGIDIASAASGGGGGGKLGGIFQAGGLLTKIPAVARFLGLGTAAAGTMTAYAADGTALLSTTAGGAGVSAGGGGLLGSMGALFSNPWTAVAAGAAIGGFFLLKHFFGENAEKKLKKAAQSAYGVEIRDKNVLKQLKTIGEGAFGKGQAGKHADEVVQIETAKDIIEQYAEQTGQNTDKLGRNDYGNENWKGNQFGTRFNGFDSPSVSSMVRSSLGPASDVSSPANASSSANSELKAALNGIAKFLAINSEAIDAFTEKFSGVATKDLLIAHSSTIGEAVLKEADMNQSFTDSFDRKTGRFV